MEITYDYYRIFYYVAKYGSFSRAAAVLLRGQPNITKAIGNLENQLGCKLFVRSNRGVTLTPEGEKLFQHAEIAFAHLSSAEAELRTVSDLTEGTVSIATTEIALYGSTMPALIAFQKDYPGVKLRLASYTNEDALMSVKNGLSDFAVVTLQENTNNEFRLTTIKAFREILCCKAGYLQTAVPPASGEVFDYPFISLHKKSYHYNLTREYFAKLGLTREPDIEVSIVDQILPLIKSGVGLGFVPDLLAAHLLETGEIEEIPLGALPPTRRICLAEDRKRSLSLAARAFIEYLQ